MRANTSAPGRATLIAMLRKVPSKRWINTGLESATQKEVQIALTPKLLAVATNESGQGNRDLNGDRDNLERPQRGVHDLTRPILSEIDENGIAVRNGIDGNGYVKGGGSFSS